MHVDCLLIINYKTISLAAYEFWTLGATAKKTGGH